MFTYEDIGKCLAEMLAAASQVGGAEIGFDNFTTWYNVPDNSNNAEVLVSAWTPEGILEALSTLRKRVGV